VDILRQNWSDKSCSISLPFRHEESNPELPPNLLGETHGKIEAVYRTRCPIYDLGENCYGCGLLEAGTERKRIFSSHEPLRHGESNPGQPLISKVELEGVRRCAVHNVRFIAWLKTVPTVDFLEAEVEREKSLLLIELLRRGESNPELPPNSPGTLLQR
jgi:hypothetical protein